ncbi:MAG: hypothetical protein HeimC3_49110 [Candidatus Heimdallarchaeota archaeon LC_3]|nr:MAG: hypothetical protein HeimC3_49110 [Candidatus Heimdallarchaeota archaeon LC_3]
MKKVKLKSMKRNKLSKLSFVLIFSFLLLITPILQANAEAYKIKITDAGYDDLDKDGKSDDIYLFFIIVNKEKDDANDDKNNKNEFVLKFVLELPSGYKYSYSWKLELNKVRNTLHFIIHAFNTATEPGWYTSYLFLYEDGDDDLIAYNSLVFDPPGTGIGAEPEFFLFLLGDY